MSQSDAASTAATNNPVEPPRPAAPNRPEARSPFADEPYTYEQCTLTLTLQFWPEDGHAQGRRVLIGLRNHQDPPILKLVREQEVGELPAVVGALLAQLRA